MASKQTSLVDLLQNASETDLAEIDKQISEIEAKITELKNERTAYLEVRKVISVRLHGKPAPKKKSPKAKAAGEGSDMAKRIFDLLQEKGPRPMPLIAIDLGSTAAAVGRCVASSDWFVRSVDGKVSIATK